MKKPVADQFYTKNEVAQACLANARTLLESLAGKQPFYIEPSAGDGAFFRLLPGERRHGIDLYPKAPGIHKEDFLESRFRSPVPKAKTIVIGNPPFGKRGSLAAAFINQAFRMADTVAFIVPIIFRKHLTQKKIAAEARWVGSWPLPRDAFRIDGQESYAVNTEFQVWTKITSGHADMREVKRPAIAHPDFAMWQYNNTKQALKVFRNPFQFAVPCQGWQDYSRRETKEQNCEKQKQWMLFASGKDEILTKLIEMDFEALAVKNTTTVPGFRKGDVVKEYCEMYGKPQTETQRSLHGTL